MCLQVQEKQQEGRRGVRQKMGRRRKSLTTKEKVKDTNDQFASTISQGQA